MSIICRHCLPAQFQGFTLPVLWTADNRFCHVCGKERAWLDLFEVKVTVQDVRYANWVEEYERGSRE